MFRGCSSDSTKIRLQCDKNEDGMCIKCSGSGCNDQPKIRKAELACVQCNGTAECAFGQDSATATACLNDVKLGDEESCFVRTLPGNNTNYLSLLKVSVQFIERGCTLDANTTHPEWCKEDTDCETCSGDGCNTRNVQTTSCLQCKSDAKGYCAKVSNTTEFFVKCDHSSYSYDKRGCFTIFKGTL